MSELSHFWKLPETNIHPGQHHDYTRAGPGAGTQDVIPSPTVKGPQQEVKSLRGYRARTRTQGSIMTALPGLKPHLPRCCMMSSQWQHPQDLLSTLCCLPQHLWPMPTLKQPKQAQERRVGSWGRAAAWSSWGPEVPLGIHHLLALGPRNALANSIDHQPLASCSPTPNYSAPKSFPSLWFLQDPKIHGLSPAIMWPSTASPTALYPMIKVQQHKGSGVHAGPSDGTIQENIRPVLDIPALLKLGYPWG